MKIELTDTPTIEDEVFVVANTRAHNFAVVPNDFRKVCAFLRDDSDRITGGLVGTTYWHYLDISFLWVAEEHRQRGYATQLMNLVEAEAIARGCTNALVDTFSFQARGFYEKQGFKVFGCLGGFSGQHERYYMHKPLLTAVNA